MPTQTSPSSSIRDLRAICLGMDTAALILVIFSILANVMYWTRGLTGLDYYTNMALAGGVEILLLFLLWTSSTIWKRGAYMLATLPLVIASFLWAGSSVSHFMYLATLDAPLIAKTELERINAAEKRLVSDRASVDAQLQNYSGYARADVATLESQEELCKTRPKSECDSVLLGQQIATNKSINELETRKASIDINLDKLAIERSAVQTGTNFSVKGVVATFNEQKFSRASMLILVLELFKLSAFAISFWARTQIDKARATTVASVVSETETLRSTIAELEALKDALEKQTEQAERMVTAAVSTTHRAAAEAENLRRDTAVLSAASAHACTPTNQSPEYPTVASVTRTNLSIDQATPAYDAAAPLSKSSIAPGTQTVDGHYVEVPQMGEDGVVRVHRKRIA